MISCALTNEEGVVSGMVAANEILTLQVYEKCDQEIFTTSIRPYADEVFLGPVGVTDPNVQSHVSGFAVGCAGQPMTNGFVKITSGQYTYYVVPDLITGAFETVVTGCSEEKFSVYSFDANDDFFSKPHTFLFSPIMETDTLFTCDSIDEFVIIHIEGFSNPIYYDSVDIKLFKDGNDATSIRGLDVSGSSFGIWFQGQNTGHYIAQFILRLSSMGISVSI